MPLQSSHIQTVLATTFVKRFCSEKLCLYQTLGLHSHGVVSHFLHSWEHSQTAENKVTFPLCQKDLNTFLSGACSSHHVRAAQPALQLVSFRGTQKCKEGSSPCLPPLPELCTVTRGAHSLQQGMDSSGWGKLLWESCSWPPLPFHFGCTTDHPVFRAAESVSVLRTKYVSKWVKWV